MYEVSRKTSSFYGFGQRSGEADEDTWGMHNRTGMFESAPSGNRIRRRTRKVDDDESKPSGKTSKEVNETDAELRQKCIDKIMELESTLNICKLAKYFNYIMKEIKRHDSLIAIILNYQYEPSKRDKKMSFDSVMNRSIRDVTTSNSRLKKFIDRIKKRLKPGSGGGRPGRGGGKSPKRKPMTPSIDSI
ncbi:uncharacterized protein [Venturia canescens]|uniref:uncharacterized protein n=1 Tax=Venturia canescens TaxID=32260 RepID=UPI001C9BDF13|nr:uncharacterized protein LOC122415878 [Venturia canescens]